MAENNRTEWYIQVINARTGQPVDDDIGTAQVLNAGLPSEATVYSTSSATAAATNPLTLRDGAARFYTDASVTTVDLSVVSKGMGKFLRGFAPSDHNVQIDLDGQSTIVTIYGATLVTEVDTGVVIEGPTRLIHHWLQPIVAAGSSATISVGLNAGTPIVVGDTVNTNDPNCFMNAVDINLTTQTAVAVAAATGNSKVLVGSYANVTYERGTGVNGAGTGYVVLHVGRSPA